MFINRFIIIFCLLLLPSNGVFSSEMLRYEKESAYRYVNQLRTRSGLIPFTRNNILEQSAINHARYLSSNSLAGHMQNPDTPGFTGIKPDDRALYAGYASRDVAENFSFGQKNAQQSIDGLMSAIYHRFAFLELTKDEMGIGIKKNHKGLNFVYNIGNSHLNHFCKFAIFLNDGAFYTNACKRGDKVSATEVNLRKGEVGKRNPDMVVWPFDGATRIPPAFFEEVPDPLPDYKVSGYPVSVQVNPFYTEKVELQRFKLFLGESELEIRPVRVMTKQLDPHQRFTAFDFALFPLNRLEWDTEYRAEIALKAKGHTLSKTWRFRTEKAPYPMFVINGRNENLQLVSNKRYMIHLPPERQYPYMEKLRWESMSDVKTSVAWQDRNTIIVELKGKECESTHFFLNGDRSFILQVAARDNLNLKQNYPRGSLPSCLINTIKDLPGFKVSARGEVIPMKVDQDYWVEIDSPDMPVTEVSWQLNGNMKIQVVHLERNILKVRLSGLPGQIATFYLSNSRIFKVVLTE